MSAPDTNVEKQTKRHKPALLATAVAVGAAIFALIAFNLWGGPPSEEQAAPTVVVDQ